MGKICLRLKGRGHSPKTLLKYTIRTEMCLCIFINSQRLKIDRSDRENPDLTRAIYLSP